MLNPNSLCPGCMTEKLTNGKCPICGYNPEEPRNPQLLAANSLLVGKYVIGKPIDINGESVTYLSIDADSGVIVNVREYFPQGLCTRDTDGSVLMTSGNEYYYNNGLNQFVDLSKKLLELNDVPATFDVVDIIEANNTAYRITRAVQGIPLREFLMRNGGVLNWELARSLFAPLVPSIAALHKAGIIHRGISPDTVFVGKDGRLRLNGFCIAPVRTANTEFSSQLFPGFAAIEQYRDAGGQGTWTDVYALAATVYRTLVGNPPPEATERLENDNMTIPAKVAKETPVKVLETLANALQILPDDRTQHIEDMRKGLSTAVVSTAATGAAVAKAAAGAATAAKTPEQKASTPRPTRKKSKKASKTYGLIAFGATAVLLAIIIIIVLWAMGVFGGGDNNSSDSMSSVQSITSSVSDVSSTPTHTGYTDLMPDFRGMKFSDVINNSSYANIVKFKIVSKEYSDEYNPGEIVAQSPAPGTDYEVGKTTVELVISAGSYYIEVPDLKNMELDAAKAELYKLGFRDDTIIIEYVNVVGMAPGRVAGTLPSAGGSINTEMKIYIKVNILDSSGGATTPDTSSQEQ